MPGEEERKKERKEGRKKKEKKKNETNSGFEEKWAENEVGLAEDLFGCRIIL